MACAEGAARGEQQRKRRNLARAILTCFCARASCCSSRTQDLRSESRDEDDVAEEGMKVGGRRFSSSKNGVVVAKPLRKIAEAFEELANVVKSESESADVVEVAAFSTACSYVGTLFGCIGFHFKFIEMDYLTKVNDLADASKRFRTLESMVDKDMQTNTVRNQGSHSRNLLMIKRGLDFLRALFQQILLTEGNSIREAVQKAYTDISVTSWLGSEKGCCFKGSFPSNKAAIM